MKTDPETVRLLLRAPFESTKPVERLGAALWLYLLLVRSANERGMLIRTRSRIAADLGVTEDDVDRWVERLVEAKLVRVVSPSPYLAMTLSFWPSDSSHDDASKAVSGSDSANTQDASGSSKQQAAAAAASSNRGDGSPREGEVTDDEIRDVLGEPDLDAQELVRGVSRHVVRKALQRVRLTPASQIRKSKAALFRFLLAKFSDEIDVNDL